MMLNTGCLKLTADQKREIKETAEYAVPLPEYSWKNRGEMPVIKWDSHFDRWLERRIDRAEGYRKKGFSLYPWDVLGAMPDSAKRSDRFGWNQGSIPSCSMHGASHAYQCAELTAIALGAPLFYEAMNPIYPFYAAKGGSLSGGLDMNSVVQWINKKGMTPESLVGGDNRDVYRCKLKKIGEGVKWQAGIVLIEDDLEEKIVKACRGLCSVCFGAGQFFTRARSADGLRIMTGITSGGHAQAFTSAVKRGKDWFVFNINSHGDIYRDEDSERAPFCGAWAGPDELAAYCRTMDDYGMPFIVFPEGEFRRVNGMINDFELPRLSN